MPDSTTDTLLDAILAQGVLLIHALDGDDFDGAAAFAQARGTLVAQLPPSGSPPDAVRAARLTQQDRVLAEQAQGAHERLAAALRRTGQFQHASDSYAPPPPRTRLHARG